MGENIQQLVNKCPYCSFPVAPGDPEKIQTEKGLAHFSHVYSHAIKELNSVKLAKPRFSERHLFFKHLKDLATNLINQPRNPNTERQLSKVVSLSEEIFLRPPIDISKLKFAMTSK